MAIDQVQVSNASYQDGRRRVKIRLLVQFRR